MWNKTAVHFRNHTVSISAAARAIRDRLAVGYATNPTFSPFVTGNLGEAALYLKAMQGNFEETKTEYVQILFRKLNTLLRTFFAFLTLTQFTGEERIPFNEGYKRSNVSISTTDLGRISNEIRPMLGKYKDLE